MDAAQTIRDAVARVSALRRQAHADPRLQAATVAVKAFQAQRFAGTYADLLAGSEYRNAALFFLEDLYSDRDYSRRDAQFARIAGGLQRLFPQQVVATAVALAKLHVLTEELDNEMASTWMVSCSGQDGDSVSRYMTSWSALNREADRNRQLDMVLYIGQELDRLTRVRGLRLMLRMMRAPATAAGLESLQAFLESGFDTFAQMSGASGRAQNFLSIIRDRESSWIARLSGADLSTCENELRACVANVP